MEREKGIEPSPQAWEARVLPLNYSRSEFSSHRVAPGFGCTPQSVACHPTAALFATSMFVARSRRVRVAGHADRSVSDSRRRSGVPRPARFFAHAGEERRTEENFRGGGPDPRNHGDYGPHGEGRMPGAALRKATRLAYSG